MFPAKMPHVHKFSRCLICQQVVVGDHLLDNIVVCQGAASRQILTFDDDFLAALEDIHAVRVDMDRRICSVGGEA